MSRRPDERQHVIYAKGERFAERIPDKITDVATTEYNRELTRKRRVAEARDELREIDEFEL